MTELLDWTRVRAFVFLWRRWGPQERATIWESGGTGFCLVFITGTLYSCESGVSPPWSSVLTSVWWTRWSLIFFPAVYTILRDLDIWWKHRTVYWHWYWYCQLTLTINIDNCLLIGIYGCSDSKESAWNKGDPGLIPGLGRSPGEGNDHPLQYSCLENTHRQRSLVGYRLWWRRVGHDWVTNTYAQAFPFYLMLIYLYFSNGLPMLS